MFRGSRKPTQQISIITYIHSWNGYFYLYSCCVEIFAIPKHSQNKSQSDIFYNINLIFQRA
jgi:hypothetical protein